MPSSPTNKKIISIIWAQHCVRSTQYSERLGAKLYKVHYGEWKSRSVWKTVPKYIRQFFKTWQILLQERPDVIYVPTSPIFAPLTVYTYCLLFRAHLLMDVHGNAFVGQWAWSKRWHAWLARRIAACIVDQQWRKELFEGWGGRIFLLYNPPLTVQHEFPDTSAEHNRFRVTVVNTFNGDEPLFPILDAADLLPEVDFFILGNLAKAPAEALARQDGNIFFTDYLVGDAYWRQLASSDAVMVLTTLPYSLLGGAQEGLYFAKPLILSDQPSLRAYFGDTAVYVDQDHTPASLVHAIQQTQQQQQQRRQATQTLANDKETHWENEFAHLQTFIAQLR
jgi:glycosyltransferase involved in cell wall biosynthesis